MLKPSNRRQFLRSVGAGGTVSAFASITLSAQQPHVRESRVISQLNKNYHGWPTLARRRNGELLVVCSGGRESHVCPFGRVELIRSRDDGHTWSWPRTVMDGPIDDRDAGMLETAKGSLLVTTFTSLAYEPLLERSDDWARDRRARWQSAHQRVGPTDRNQALGVWLVRSTDGGVTWSGRYDSLVNSPHGPVQLSDGRLLYAGKDLWREPHRVGVCESLDDGLTWKWLAEIPVRDGDDHREYHELHAVEVGDRIVVHIRNHNQENERETLQTVSTDGGRSWSMPEAIGVWGLPSHLLRLRDDRLLMSYGHRRPPLGNQARLSADQGRTWSDPLMISTDGPSGDLGYPSTVELADGSFLTVWYEQPKSSPFAQLRQARWELG
jgi:sialidase-1